MKKLALAVVALAIAAVAVWKLWPRATPQTAANDPPAAAVAAKPTTGPATSPHSRVRKLNAEDRRALGEQIKASIARSRAASSNSTASAQGSAPVLPDEPTLRLEDVSEQMMKGLQDALPLVAKCYEQFATAKEAAALMTMISDPELGTVIDTDAITDRDNKPIDPKLDDCMRNVIDSLALPPLGQPGKLKVQYTFRFDE